MSDSTAYDKMWWKKPKGRVHEAVFPYVKRLDTFQSYRQEDNMRNMRLYGNMEFRGIMAFNSVRVEPSVAYQNRVTLNVVQSMVDTVTSKITKNKPKPYFITDGGDWTQQRKAEKLTQFAEGQFHATDFYAKASQAFKDSCIFGTGCLKIYKHNGEICVERTFIDEIKVDDVEGYYGVPRQMHQTKWVHKDVLAAMFPGKKDIIDNANVTPQYETEAIKRTGDMVLVIESWHLPSGPDAKDGKRAISISNDTLFEERYDKHYFPFVFFKWNEKPIGFWGQGIAEQLTGLQIEINKILRTIQISMHLVSIPKIYVEASSKIVTAHLNNKIGGIIKYAGQPPTEGKLGSVPVELFNHLNSLYQRAYEIIGISQLSAQAQKPAGLNSGKAMRTYNDLESERFMDVAQRYEKVFLSASEQMIQLAKELAEETGNFEVKVPGSGFLKTINWADVDMDENQYVLQLYPTNALSDTPSARLQEVQELLQAGFIGKEDGMKLLDFPDLKAFYNMANAGVEDIERQIDRMMEAGEYQTPEPYQNLMYGIKKMQQAYLMYRSQGAPEDKLELLRRWIEDANDLIKTAQQEVAQQQMQAQAAVQAPQLARPAAPPTSDLQALPGAGPAVA